MAGTREVAGLSPTVERLQCVSSQSIVFGHQSVGYDVLNGLRRIAKQARVPVVIHDNVPSVSESAAGIYQFAVGHNRDPRGKITHFEQVIAERAAAPAQIAMLKLCYIDFERETDVAGLARLYVDAMRRLSSANSNTRIIAWTVPLTSVQSGPKAGIKRMLGRWPAEYDNNARRAVFNEILRRELDSRNLFDVANIESTADTGAAISYTYRGQVCPALDPALTSDGGHLNERGQTVVAGALLEVLARSNQ